MRLTVDEIVHHDDVVRLVIVWTRSNVTADDSDAGDPRVVELDPEERKTSVTRCGRYKAAKQQPAIGAEELDQRACTAIATFRTWTTAIRAIDVSEDRTETGNGGSRSTV